MREPWNLGRGWVRFDYKKALRRPVRIINDAAMQALGSYAGGSMLFLGLGTGLGSTMIVDKMLIPLELAHLPYVHGKTYESTLGEAGFRELGQARVAAACGRGGRAVHRRVSCRLRRPRGRELQASRRASAEYAAWHQRERVQGRLPSLARQIACHSDAARRPEDLLFSRV